MKAPYGFVEDDVFWLVARLFKRGDLTFTVNGATVSLNNKTEEELSLIHIYLPPGPGQCIWYLLAGN